MLRDLQTTAQRLQRLTAERHRMDAARARSDTRDWVKVRRERTRHLIELGGLVHKAGLVELLHNDRATLLGALLELAHRLRSDEYLCANKADLLSCWRRHGLRAFDADEATVVIQNDSG